MELQKISSVVIENNFVSVVAAQWHQSSSIDIVSSIVSGYHYSMFNHAAATRPDADIVVFKLMSHPGQCAWEQIGPGRSGEDGEVAANTITMMVASEPAHNVGGI